MTTRADSSRTDGNIKSDTVLGSSCPDSLASTSLTAMLVADPTVAGVIRSTRDAIENANNLICTLYYVIIFCVVFAVVGAVVGGVLCWLFVQHANGLIHTIMLLSTHKLGSFVPGEMPQQSFHTA